MTMQYTVTNKWRARCALALIAWLMTAPLIHEARANAITEADLRAALSTAQEMPRLHSLLVSVDGELILEEYFNGRQRNQSASVKSVSKSFMSALIGIAIDQDYIAGPEQTIDAYFDDYLDPDSRKNNITVGNLLSMQAGLETTSFYNYGAWVLSNDWLSFALRQPAVVPPGTRMIYSTGNTHLLSGILTRATERSSRRFAQEYLLNPLGIDLTWWQQDPQGIYFGGNNMEFRPRDLMAFGELYRNDGRANGRQIISAEWVRESTRRLVESGRERGRFYGYGWWSRDIAGHAATYAWGFGGQYVLFVPDLQLTVVATSSAEPGENRRRHTRQLYQLLEQHIVRQVSNIRDDATTR